MGPRSSSLRLAAVGGRSKMAMTLREGEAGPRARGDALGSMRRAASSGTFLTQREEATEEGEKGEEGKWQKVREGVGVAGGSTGDSASVSGAAGGGSGLRLLFAAVKQRKQQRQGAELEDRRLRAGRAVADIFPA